MATQLHAMLSAFPRRWLEQNAVGWSAGGAEPAGVVTRAQQRALLEEVARRGGDGALLQLTRGRLSEVDEPLAYVLLNCASVEALLDKWQRLNRFFHSHHRVEVQASGPRQLVLEHLSRGGPSPVRAESLFVLGVFLTLLEELGCEGLSAWLPGCDRPDRAVVEDGRVRAPLPRGDARRWRITWSCFRPRRAPTPGLDPVLERASQAPDLERGAGLSAQVAALVQQDLAHRWTPDEVSRRLGRSRRALQRGLAAEGTTFTRCVEDTRLSEAERLLADPDRSITEIGYVCGFSDAAHFSRRFRARRGVPPSARRG